MKFCIELLSSPFSKQGPSGPWFGKNIKLLMEDKDKAEHKIKVEKPKSNITIMLEITSGCMKNPENKFKMIQCSRAPNCTGAS